MDQAVGAKVGHPRRVGNGSLMLVLDGNIPRRSVARHGACLRQRPANGSSTGFARRRQVRRRRHRIAPWLSRFEIYRKRCAKRRCVHEHRRPRSTSFHSTEPRSRRGSPSGPTNSPEAASSQWRCKKLPAATPISLAEHDRHRRSTPLRNPRPEAFPALEALADSGVATTSLWYFRLARAIATGRAEASLSRLMNDLEEPERQVARSSLGTLPGSFETLTSRVVVSLMTAIASATAANFLTLEALAVAIALDAAIVTVTTSPLLESAARLLHVLCFEKTRSPRCG